MNKTQAAGILGIASGFDRFIALDDLNTSAWFLVLEPYDFDDVQKSVVTFYRDMWNGKEQLTPRALLDDVKSKIRSDVKVAKRIGLINAEWPELDRLPEDVGEDLSTYRTAHAEYIAHYGAEYASYNMTFAEWFRRQGYTYKTKKPELGQGDAAA